MPRCAAFVLLTENESLRRPQIRLNWEAEQSPDLMKIMCLENVGAKRPHHSDIDGALFHRVVTS